MIERCTRSATSREPSSGDHELSVTYARSIELVGHLFSLRVLLVAVPALLPTRERKKSEGMFVSESRACAAYSRASALADEAQYGRL